MNLMHVKVLVPKACPTLQAPGYPPGSSVYGIFQARIREWVSPVNLPNPGVESWSPELQVDSL